jgi:Carboxypeptidase regulatory-like domain
MRLRRLRHVQLRKAVPFLIVSVAIGFFSLSAYSQVNLGRISGTITDQSGGTMANAKVTVTDQDRGVSRNLVTDVAGAYAAPSLLPGNYTVHVEASGFNISERKNVVVQVGGDTRVDIVMKPGEQTQTLTVTEELPLINTTSATLGGVMENQEVNDLPVLGHNYQQLLQLTPGVMSKPGGGSNGHSSNGMRSDANNWLFEGLFSGGVRTAGSIINTNSSIGDGASVVPPDAIQEMGVSFQNKAEFGWRPGVAANVGIKSGTNAIHGTAFAVGQTSALNARNPFLAPNDPTPELAYQQYGATVGGPIKKDKLFYFAAFEGMEMTQGTPTTHKVATTALIANDATNSIPAAYLDLLSRGKIPAGTIDGSGNVINASLLDSHQQASAQLVKAGIFQTGLPDANGNFSYGFTSTRDPNKNILGKVDYHPNDKNTITGEYFWARDTEIGNSESITQLYWTTDYYLTSNAARATWTYVPNSSWVNEFHFGFDRKVENQWPTECRPGRGAAPPDYGINTGLQSCIGAPDPNNFALPLIQISGFDDLGGGGGQRRVEGYPAWADNVSYSAGNHNIKFGADLRRSYYDGASYSNNKGTVKFGSDKVNAFSGATSLEDFLMGVPSNGSLTIGNPVTTNRNWSWSTFVQDDWRITQRVTLNLGLRWEHQTALAEDNNLNAQFDPTSPTGLTQVGQSGLSTPWKASWGWPNLQPRFGAVWDINGDGKTVLRGAYGIYGSWPVWSVLTSIGSNPTAALFYSADGTTIQGTGTIGTANVSFLTAGGTPPSPQITWTTAGPMFPAGQIACGNGLARTGGGPKNPGTCTIQAIDQNWSLPYVQQWNVGVQRSLGSNMSVDIAYVGNHGTNLIGVYDLNIAPVGNTDATRIQTSRPYYSQFPWMGKIIEKTNKDHSNYNALQASLTQRSWHGLTSTFAYTYSHTLDVAGTDLNQQVYPDVTCPLCNYGPTPFDIRHRVTIRATYLFPDKKGYGQMLEGWQISTVVNLQGKTPWTTSDNSNNLSGTGEGRERWSMAGNAKDFDSYGRFDPIPCFGASGSKFGKDSSCTVGLPQACIDAANALPGNSSLGSTALASLNSIGCYMAGNSVIVPPAQGTIGNMGPYIFRSSAYHDGDVSVRKNFHFGERLNSQFQFDMYNVTNTPEFQVPGGNGNTSSNSLTTPASFGKSTATPNVGKGNVVGGSGDARRYQFGLKLTF